MRVALAPLAFLLAVVAGCGGSEGTAGEGPSLEGQPWVLVSGVPLPLDVPVTPPSATFEDGVLGGSTGCNRYTTHYTTDGGRLEIGRIATTMMACAPPADAIERAYLAALAKVTTWSLDGEELVLAEGEAERLRFAAATPIGSWTVTGLLRGDSFTSPIGGTELTARFGAGGAISGSGGCNAFKASYTSGKGSIEITEPAATRKACGEPAGVMEQEAAYLAVLPMAVRYRVDGRSLELLGVDGARLAAFARATAP